MATFDKFGFFIVSFGRTDQYIFSWFQPILVNRILFQNFVIIFKSFRQLGQHKLINFSYISIKKIQMNF